MKSRLPLAALLSVVVALPGSARAAQFPGPDLHPLLQFHEHRLTFAGPVPPLFLVDDDLLVTRGGGLVYTQVAGDIFKGPFGTRVAQGVATPTAMASLQTSLGASHVGTLGGECLYSFPGPVWVEGNEFVISWYGAGNRTSRVRITDQTTQAPCSPAVVTLLNAVLTFRDRALSDPGITVFRTP
ncbi:MAG TPA: hypothetical protein VOA87_01600 [Thermoanaerobaculia bacterium]|nr:hypothetical protein [Thermoanaerobaculia bacterium]